MSGTAANRMNLAALQRVDSAVTEILDNASQVALYKFSAATNGWEKTEIEGALFVFSWSKTPRHGFIVMNRLSTTNLLEVITPDSEFQVQAPYLLYRNSNSGISCIWFYDTKECERIGNVCKSLKRGMAAKPNYRQRCASESDSNHRNHGNTVAGGQNGATRDIVALLAKAKDQYDMKNAGVQNGCSVGNPKGNNGGGRARGGRRNGTTSSPPARNHPNNKVNNVAANGSHNAKNDVLFKPTPLRNNGFVAAAVPPNAAESPSTPLTVATLFAAVSGGRASVSPLPAEGKDVCNGGGGGGGGREVLQELLSNPANLLEHVERMQRNEGGASSGGQASPPADASPRHRAASCVATLSAWEATDDLRQKLRLAPQSSHGSGEPSGAGPAVASQRGSGGRPNRSPPPAMVGETNAGEMFQSPAACDIPLLSPMAFTRSTSLIASSPPSSNSFSASGSPYMNGHVTEALIPPHALSGGRLPNSSSVTPLTKEQFRDALIFMLQTDNDFLVKIHEAYLGSLKSHFSVDVNSILGALGRL
ncbi:hypothetical protein HPB47_026009 [Ixodes persulcatus]|uniref:Uncharacterized protein n=1 Tax=Ixodes persulcatus TaxID=34615 RepID=A0AC60Q1X7_IXOPE|nr:hypothetical protein HPB47_026009 [Ixodes persulcatus]